MFFVPFVHFLTNLGKIIQTPVLMRVLRKSRFSRKANCAWSESLAVLVEVQFSDLNLLRFYWSIFGQSRKINSNSRLKSPQTRMVSTSLFAKRALGFAEGTCRTVWSSLCENYRKRSNPHRPRYTPTFALNTRKTQVWRIFLDP